MGKQNCWDFFQCNHNVCPVFQAHVADGCNGGEKGGRICWAIAGTFCGGKVQGTHAEKEPSCMKCDFFNQVREEETPAFQLLLPGQTYRRATRDGDNKLG